MMLKLGRFFLFGLFLLNLQSAVAGGLCQSHFSGSVADIYIGYGTGSNFHDDLWYSRQVYSIHELRLDNSNGDRVAMPSSNAYFMDDGRPRPQFLELIKEMISRPPEIQFSFDQKLTQWHGDNEMTFRRKNKLTGQYDEVVNVPVQSAFMPIRKEHYDKVVHSTGPVLQEFRRILQVYSSQQDVKIKDLGIDGLTEIEQQEYLETLDNSIYKIDKLVHPNMKDYPFLPVTGVDVALGKLEEELAQFFEFNMGTPSGLSNLIQLLEGMRVNDPRQFETVRRYMRKDKTFEALRRVIDESALHWTKDSDGISVVVGPGAGNGAHPDVAMIAYLSGMPLVDGKDLYIDREGFLRLNTGSKGDHPKVTGIYSRAEESFILQNKEDNIGLVIPSNQEVNERLNKDLGLNLEGAKTYLYKTEKRKNSKGIDEDYVIDVYRDEDGYPILSQYADQIGIDPSRPEEPAGSLAQAITDKKVFLSNVMGRIVDDKGLFDMTSKLAQQRVGNPDLVAKPPATLDPAHGYNEFYEYPQGYVAKVKDESGGNGVNIMVNLNQVETEEVVQLVQNNPRDYIIQGFVQFALSNQVEESPDGSFRWGTRANDWRIFVYFFPDGHVEGPDNSILIRGGNVGSASTNTSQNGTYLAGGPLHETPSDELKPDESLIKPHIGTDYIGISKRNDLRDFLVLLSQTQQSLYSQKSSNLMSLQFQASELARLQREVMSFFNFEHNSFMSTNRKFSEGKIELTEYKNLVTQFVTSIEESVFYFEGMDGFINDFLHPQANLTKKEQFERKLPLGSSEMVKKIRKRPLSRSQWKTVESMVNGPYDKVEVATYRFIKPELAQTDRGFVLINEIIEELAVFGGELRETSLIDEKSDKVLEDSFGSAYFRVNSKGRPIIGINLSQPMATSGLVHEFGHFKRWKKLYEVILSRLSQDSPGGRISLSLRVEAAREANRQLKFPRARFEDELNSTQIEMGEDHNSIKNPSLLNSNKFMVPAYQLHHKDYLTRILYSYSEGIKSGLIMEARGEVDGKVLSSEELSQVKIETFELMFEVIHTTLSLRKKLIKKLTADYALAKESGDRREADIIYARLKEMAQVKVFDLMYPPGSINRISGTGLVRELLNLFEEAWMRIDLENYFVYESDKEVLGPEQVDYSKNRMWVYLQNQQ